MNHLLLHLISTLEIQLVHPIVPYLEGLKLKGLKFQALEGLKFQNKQTQKQMTQTLLVIICAPKSRIKTNFLVQFTKYFTIFVAF